ncbi:MAG: RyR domain-containing protein [Devosia sp.]
MKTRRFAIYLGCLIVLAIAGIALVYWSLFTCAPPPLPGDELWTSRQNFGEAIGIVLLLGTKACFTADPMGSFALWLGSRTTGLLLILLALVVLWELLGRDLRRRWFRMNGGHVVLAGTYDDLDELARASAHPLGTFFLAPDRGAALDIARSRPFGEIVTAQTRKLPKQLADLGVGKAKLLAAATRNDLTNVAIAEAGLATPGEGELLVRLEQYAVRVFSSHRLRVRAAQQGRELAVVSLTQLQARRGMAAAMAGRYTMDGAPRVHIALCGSGPALQAASFEVARQGFGLEREKPLLSILRTGAADFATGALQRLQNSGIADVEITDVMTTVADGIDRAISATVQDAPLLAAIHCVGEDAGEAEALALRWEEVLLALHQPIPPIVAYAGEDHPLGVTGMIRVATAQDLARAREAAHLMDQRARAVHQQYLDAQKVMRGDKFGTAPAEVDWDKLPETFQDDNRNVADQMDYKLASVFMLAEPGAGGVDFDRDETEVMSGIAHARWMAAKALSGWRYGKQRDDRQMLHPDLIPYGDLDEAGRQKDRDVVASLPNMAALAGETIRRERRIGISRPLEADALDQLVANFRSSPKTVVPVAVLPLDDAGMVRLATALLAAGLFIEVLLDRWIDELRANDEIAGPLADVLRRSWRIHAVREGDARHALGELVDECASETGAIDAFA